MITHPSQRSQTEGGQAPTRSTCLAVAFSAVVRALFSLRAGPAAGAAVHMAEERASELCRNGLAAPKIGLSVQPGAACCRSTAATGCSPPPHLPEMAPCPHPAPHRSRSRTISSCLRCSMSICRRASSSSRSSPAASACREEARLFVQSAAAGWGSLCPIWHTLPPAVPYSLYGYSFGMSFPPKHT